MLVICPLNIIIASLSILRVRSVAAIGRTVLAESKVTPFCGCRRREAPTHLCPTGKSHVCLGGPGAHPLTDWMRRYVLCLVPFISNLAYLPVEALVLSTHGSMQHGEPPL